MSSAGASSSAYRRFRSGGRTPCTRCKTIIPDGETMEALPARDGQPRWTAHRCIPACTPAPRSPGPSTPAPAPGPGASQQKKQDARKPRSKRGGMKLLSDEEMNRAETARDHNKRHGGRPTLPDPSRRVAPSPTRLDLNGKRPHSSLDGGSGSGSGSGSDSKLWGKLSRPQKKARTPPAGPGSNTSPSVLVAPRSRSQRTTSDGITGGAAAMGAATPSRAAHRGGRGAGGGDGGDGVEVVRQVSVDERLAERQRKRGVIDIGDDGRRTVPLGAAAPASVAVPVKIDIGDEGGRTVPLSAALAAAEGGGSGGRSGGGVACNLAETEGWTPQAAPSVAVPVKLESSAAKRRGNNVSAALPAAAAPVAAGNNVPAGVPAHRRSRNGGALPATATPVAAGNNVPAGLLAQRPSRNGGKGWVSVSQIFRKRGERFEMRTAAKVGTRAKKMFVEEYGKAAVAVLEKRPARDGNRNKAPSGWGPGYVLENAYPSRYRYILEEAFDSVLGRAP